MCKLWRISGLPHCGRNTRRTLAPSNTAKDSIKYRPKHAQRKQICSNVWIDACRTCICIWPFISSEFHSTFASSFLHSGMYSIFTYIYSKVCILQYMPLYNTCKCIQGANVRAHHAPSHRCLPSACVCVRMCISRVHHFYYYCHYYHHHHLYSGQRNKFQINAHDSFY